MQISAHALVRWLERIEKIDITGIKREMRRANRNAHAAGEILSYLWVTRGISSNAISARVLEALRQGTPSKRGRHIICPNAVLALSGGVVVTVLTRDMRPEFQTEAA